MGFPILTQLSLGQWPPCPPIDHSHLAMAPFKSWETGNLSLKLTHSFSTLLFLHPYLWGRVCSMFLPLQITRTASWPDATILPLTRSIRIGSVPHRLKTSSSTRARDASTASVNAQQYRPRIKRGWCAFLFNPPPRSHLGSYSWLATRSMRWTPLTSSVFLSEDPVHRLRCITNFWRSLSSLSSMSLLYLPFLWTSCLRPSPLSMSLSIRVA